MNSTLVKQALEARWIAGSFDATTAALRQKVARLTSLQRLWNKWDWDFKVSQATITATSGNKGGYSAPSGMVRFASTHKLYLWGLDDAERLRPIKSTDTKEWFVYLDVESGQIYFREDPGDNTLTLNYVGSFDPDPANIATTEALFDDGLFDAHVTMSYAELIRFLPGMDQMALDQEKRAMNYAADYWQDKTQGRYQKTISPRGINGFKVDRIAQRLNVLGQPLVLLKEDD